MSKNSGFLNFASSNCFHLRNSSTIQPPEMTDPVSDQRNTDIAKYISKDYVEACFFLNDNKEDIDTDFQILTSIRYDPNLKPESDDQKSKCKDDTSKFFVFEEHYRRVKLELDYFKWDIEIPKDIFKLNLNETIKLTGDPTIPYKLRVLVHRDGSVKITAVKTAPRENLAEGLFELNGQLQLSPSSSPTTIYKIYLDTIPTPVSPFTSFKTTYRPHYNAARERILTNPTDYTIHQDVLLYNHLNQIMECTISNVAFMRNGKWTTPPISAGGLCGTVRQWLINKQMVVEGQILMKDVEIGEEILYFNAVIGVVRGIITKI